MPSPLRLCTVVSVLGLLLLFQAPAKAAAVQPLYRQLQDWLLACDNTRSCEAKSLRQDNAFTLSIEREAGPDATPILVAEGPGAFAVEHLRLDGRPWRAVAWEVDGDAQYTTLTLQDDSTAAVIRRLLTAQRLTLEQSAEISLAGLRDALRLMDETQGRSGTQGALVAVGGKPDSQVPAAPEAPELGDPYHAPPLAAGDLSGAVRQAQAAFLGQHCDAAVSGAPRDSQYPLNDDDALVVLECRREPYQSKYLLYQAPRQQPAAARLLQLPLPDGIAPAEAAPGPWTLAEAEFDPGQASLWMATRHRAQGDCGVAARWLFDGQRFQIAEYREQRLCGGPSGDWPVLYRTDEEQALSGG